MRVIRHHQAAPVMAIQQDQQPPLPQAMPITLFWVIGLKTAQALLQAVVPTSEPLHQQRASTKSWLHNPHQVTLQVHLMRTCILMNTRD